MEQDSSVIIQEEESLLQEIRKKIIENPVGAERSPQKIHKQMLALRDEILDAKTEDLPALYEQMNHLNHIMDQIEKTAKKDEINPDSPYFAHMRLCEKGKERDVFLGKTTMLSHGLRIVDWRHAPISKIFYRYQEGDEYEERIAGRDVEGEVVTRRTLFINKGELLRISNSTTIFVKNNGQWRQLSEESMQLAGGEGSALRAGSTLSSALGAGAQLRSSKLLPDIAALIDEDQFELISAQTEGAIVIRGSAGSGKTTVALHRLAFLCFQDPKRFRPDRMMFIVWGKAMRDYIRNVLPSLGVSGVFVTTWSRWSRTMVRNLFHQLPRRISDFPPDLVSQIKLHPKTERRLAAYIEKKRGSSSTRQAIEDWLHVITDFAAIRRDLGPDLSQEQFAQAERWLRNQSEELISALDEEPEAQPYLDPEDDALLLRAYQLRVGKLRHKGKDLQFTHVAIDEVQDFSPVEIMVIMDICDKHRSLTLAGDTRQHISKEAGFHSWSSFLDQVGLKSSALHTLDISYRSTHPITRFAVSVLKDNEEPLPTTLRDGPSVELFQFSDHGACAMFLAEELQKLLSNESLANVALLTPNEDLTDTYAKGLQDADVPNVRRVRDQSFAFTPGVDVVEADQVKGLEFDYVVIIEPSARFYPDTDHHRRLLHVASTRAVHQLWLTCVGTTSSIIREVLV
jgi:DNA helicase-2/ATP-dependent DNA helicase PcrA